MLPNFWPVAFFRLVSRSSGSLTSFHSASSEPSAMFLSSGGHMFWLCTRVSLSIEFSFTASAIFQGHSELVSRNSGESLALAPFHRSPPIICFSSFVIVVDSVFRHSSNLTGFDNYKFLEKLHEQYGDYVRTGAVLTPCRSGSPIYVLTHLIPDRT